MFEITTLFLVFGGVVLGVAGVLVGGTMFFGIPFLQMLFPQAGFGVLVGNFKVASFVRGLGSTIGTLKEIEWVSVTKMSALGVVGSIVGASLIADLDRFWMLPAMILAVILVFTAPILSRHLSRRWYYPLSFACGLYTGILGAGIGIYLIALFRLIYPADSSISHVKIQARYAEWLMTGTSVIAHIYHGNLVNEIWIPFAIGNLIGGILGAVALKKIGTFSGDFQKKFLIFGCALSIIVALLTILK